MAIVEAANTALLAAMAACEADQGVAVISNAMRTIIRIMRIEIYRGPSGIAECPKVRESWDVFSEEETQRLLSEKLANGEVSPPCLLRMNTGTQPLTRAWVEVDALLQVVEGGTRVEYNPVC